MIDFENQTDLLVELSELEEIAHSVTNREIELIIVNNETIKNINFEYREKNEATDVLSFPFDGDFAHLPLGTIIISKDFVTEKAKEYNHSNNDEIKIGRASCR